MIQFSQICEQFLADARRYLLLASPAKRSLADRMTQRDALMCPAIKPWHAVGKIGA